MSAKLERQKQKLMSHYQKCLSTMITDLDFKRYFGVDTQVLKYSDLADYLNINQLLPKETDFKIILTESKPNEGHWCVLLKYNGGRTIEWFDSYGVRPDGELSFIPNAIKKMLGEDKHYLSKLIKTMDQDQHFVYNKTKFQKLQDGINTCGRWVICRTLMMQFGFNLEEFTNFIERQKRETDKPYDILLCDWII